jgi:hydrogenase nickel incorporation protein HypA/HybF
VHELGIALEVIDLACARAEGARVRRVRLEVGALTAVLPDALRFAWELATEETAAEGATLEIVEVPGDVLRIREMEVCDVRDVRM